MKIVVCLETLPDPDCVILKNGEFDFENCRVRLDSYSAAALEFALSLKDTYGMRIEAILLDSFEMKNVFEDIKALGCEKVNWIKVPFSFDPFKRAENFADAITCDNDDIVIAGYHCETCCTNSIPKLIALNKSLPYYPEVNSVSIENDSIVLKTFKSDKELELEKKCMVVSIRTSRKLRYPSLKERLTCQEEENELLNKSESARTKKYDGSGCFSADVVNNGISITVTENTQTQNAAAVLIGTMNDNGMFQI